MLDPVCLLQQATIRRALCGAGGWPMSNADGGQCGVIPRRPQLALLSLPVYVSTSQCLSVYLNIFRQLKFLNYFAH